MSDISLLGAPGHLMFGATTPWTIRMCKSAHGRAFVRPRGARAWGEMTNDLCRSARERSP